ncbi:uncharacterized protein [Periplaneta americana]|uniref:uncharacterized protein n=1 Tax=Periplaneta americana TaxID=6978 RepID=UPI0037E83597
MVRRYVGYPVLPKFISSSVLRKSSQMAERVDVLRQNCTCHFWYKHSSHQRDGTLDPRTENAFNMNAKVVLYIAVVLSGTQLTSASIIISLINSTVSGFLNQVNDITGQVQNGLKTAIDNGITKLDGMKQQYLDQAQADFANAKDQGAAAHACLDNVEDNVFSLIDNALSQLKTFGAVEGFKALLWVEKVKATKNKIEGVAANLTSGTQACLAQGSMFDLIGKAACETALVNSLTPTVSDISTEVQQDVESGKTILEGVNDGSQNMVTVLDSLFKEFARIGHNESQCLAAALFK